jgi:hypothetical protein
MGLGDDLSYTARMKKAYRLLVEGLKAEHAFTSSRYAPVKTPKCFTDVDRDLEFYPHQRSDAGKIDHILWSGEVEPKSVSLAWGMGLGKSMTMQAVMHKRRRRTNIIREPTEKKGDGEGPILLVVPVKLLEQWQEQLSEINILIIAAVYVKEGLTVKQLLEH